MSTAVGGGGGGGGAAVAGSARVSPPAGSGSRNVSMRTPLRCHGFPCRASRQCAWITAVSCVLHPRGVLLAAMGLLSSVRHRSACIHPPNDRPTNRIGRERDVPFG